MKLTGIVLYLRSFAASAFVGVVYLLLIELVQLLSGYQTALVHSAVVLALYLVGIYFNYILQKNVVFDSDRKAVVQFFAYNFFSAALVSVLSSFFYRLPLMQSIFGAWIESASTAASLLIVSPISFLFFRMLFHARVN